MSRRNSLLAISALLAAAAVVAAPPTAIHCGHQLDVLTGKMLGATTVVIDGNKVREVTAGLGAPAGAVDIDLSSQTCLPGLIDSHTHLSSQSSPTQYLDNFHWNNADYVVRSTVYARRTLLAGFRLSSPVSTRRKLPPRRRRSDRSSAVRPAVPTRLV